MANTKTMRIVLLDPPHGDVFARELIDGELAGHFRCDENGVTYTHPISGELYAALSVERFQDAVRAWEAYCESVVVESDQPAQLHVVGVLRTKLEHCGVLNGVGFWDIILEQAEDGML